MRHCLRHILFLVILSGWITAASAQSNPVHENNNNNRSASRDDVDKLNELDDNKIQQKTETKKTVQTIAVYEPVYQKQTGSWYGSQAEAWRQAVELDKTNADAWFNYYKSSRYGGMNKSELDQIVAGMNANIPNTFETHYVNYIHSDRDLSKGSELMQAYLLNPNRKELYKELAVYFTLKNDKDNLVNTLKKWSTIGDIPQSLMDYGYNLLNTVPQQGILVTDGEYDTYPLWVLQASKNHRTDVKVLNIDLLKNEAYKERICQEFGLTCYGSAFSRPAFIQNLVNNNPGKVFYFSYTVNSAALEPIESGLLNEGLAFRYNTDPNYDYTTRLENNWELVYKTDYLQQAAGGNDQFSSGKMRSLNLNYVSSGLELYDLYQAKGEKDKAGKLYELLLKLAKAAGKEDVVKSYISK